MKTSIRKAVITTAILFATAAPAFATIGGTDPRPPQNSTASTAAVVAQSLLPLLGL